MWSYTNSGCCDCGGVPGCCDCGAPRGPGWCDGGGVPGCCDCGAPWAPGCGRHVVASRRPGSASAVTAADGWAPRAQEPPVLVSGWAPWVQRWLSSWQLPRSSPCATCRPQRPSGAPATNRACQVRLAVRGPVMTSPPTSSSLATTTEGHGAPRAPIPPPPRGDPRSPRPPPRGAPRAPVPRHRHPSRGGRPWHPSLHAGGGWERTRSLEC